MQNDDLTKIKVRLTHGDRVLRIVLAAPPGNVLDARMMEEIAACLKREGKRPELRAVVFSSESKHFCFGASVAEHQKDQAPSMIRSFNSLFKDLLALAVPTFSLVKGQCLGGGMELASFCNFVIAEPGAKFGQPEINLGVLPPVAALILPSIIGQLRADDLILTGRSINAETAHEWGLVHEVCDDVEEALEKALEKHFLPKSAEALRMANRASRAAWHRRLAGDLDDMERFYVDRLMETHDANEGIVSFLEKRKPLWQDR